MKAPVREFVEHFNHNVISVVQFETRTAMERADDLPSVKGVDISMLGPADLSISLGVPGQFDHPLVVSTIERLIENCYKTRSRTRDSNAGSGDSKDVGRSGQCDS